MPDREQWIGYLMLVVGLILLGLMGWGLTLGVSSLVQALRSSPPGEASIALSAGFVSPVVEETKAQPAPVGNTGVAQAEEPVGSGGSGELKAVVPGAEEAKLEAGKNTKEEDAAPQVFEIRGSVQKAGQPVRRGKVRLTVSLVGERFRQSTLTDLNEKGEFSVYNDRAFQVLNPKSRIRVLAEVWPAPGQGVSLPLTETVYINHNLPSWIRSSTGWGFVACVLLLAVLFLWAFTGQSTYGKNRIAIILSYCVIFLSLAGALVGPTLLMLAAPDLPEISGRVPVGLVVAKLTENSKPEWMLNLGGYVKSGESEEGPATVTQTRGGNGSAGKQNVDLGAPVLRVVSLNGGIQIPLYVILLALIGGAINMTRQVPEFQSRQPVQRGFFNFMWRRPAASAPGEGEERNEAEKENGSWRKGLLDQYMFLVAAPFLAIATYYLLILLGTIQPPIIVLVYFSIGLISDTVVTAITKAARKLLGGEQVKPGTADPSDVGASADKPDGEVKVDARQKKEDAGDEEEDQKKAA